MVYPDFFHGQRAIASGRILKNSNTDYNPMLGAWLIELALMFEWYKPPLGRRKAGIFTSDDFMGLTGLPYSGDEDECCDDPIVRKKPDSAQGKKMLEDRLMVLRETRMSPDLPLFQNIQMLADTLGLSDTNQALLLFTAVMKIFSQFRDAIANQNECVPDAMLCQILERLTGLSENEFRKAIAPDGLLITTGLVACDPGMVDLENKLYLLEGLAGSLLSPQSGTDELIRRFLRRASVSALTLDHFPHLSRETDVLRLLVNNAVRNRASGVNILFHGKPGVGKTGYVQALAADLGLDLYEISFSDEDGNPIRGEARLRAYNLSQHILGESARALLMFDEIEDVFPDDFGFLGRLFRGGSQSGSQGAGKAWVNRTLERNPIPAIWICNTISQIDPAYLRRFDFSVQFPNPPHRVRCGIARHHLGFLDPPQDWIEQIAASEETTPGQLERAAKVARIAAGDDKALAMKLAGYVLEQSACLLDQKRVPARNTNCSPYRMDYLNTDGDIARIVNGLSRRPRGTFCFYGVSGAGKSMLARHIAHEIGKPVRMHRASDLLGKYVGESEKNMAAMFVQASREQAVLVLDEADSFLGDRRDAHHSWEMVLVNELLTQMETFDGIFICTTNLMEKLDPASLRRFDFKIRFDPMTPDQAWYMFTKELKRLGWDEPVNSIWKERVCGLKNLTPGDFAVAARQIDLLENVCTPDYLYDRLYRECIAKGSAPRNVGFCSRL